MSFRLRRLSASLAALPGALALLAPIAVASHVTPPNQIVFVANSANKRIVKIDFDHGTTTVVNTDHNKLKKPVALAVRDDGGGVVHLLVCDEKADKVLFYLNAQGTGQQITAKPSPDGISLDRQGNAYFVSNSSSQVWKIPRGGSLPGGYAPAVLIDPALPNGPGQDTKIVNTPIGGTSSGDLLVLTKNKVWRYPEAAPCNPGGCAPSQRVLLINSFPSGFDPTGMAFDANGNPIFTGLGGSIIRFINGGFQTVKSGLGNGLFGIAAGPQQGVNRVFVFQRNNHRAYSFDLAPNGSLTNQRIVNKGLTFPQKGGIGTARWVPAPASAPGQSTTIQIESVENTMKLLTGGYFDRTCKFTLPDPRFHSSHYACKQSCPGGAANCDGPFCKRNLLLSELGVPAPNNVIIPVSIRPFEVCDPANAGLRFYLCIGDTTAGLDPTDPVINHIEDEDEWLMCGPLEPDPEDSDNTSQPRFLKATIPGVEPPVVEDTPSYRQFVDYSVQGNSNRAATDDYSYILPAVRDFLPLCQIADTKLTNLEATRAMFATSIGPSLNSKVERGICAARNALRAHAQADPYDDCILPPPSTCPSPDPSGCDEAIDIHQAICIADFVGSKLRSQVGQIGTPSDGRNLAGDLISRSDSGEYFLCKVGNFPVDLCPQPSH